MTLERAVQQNGVVIYVSPQLKAIGVPHAFSTRVGGTSAGVFGTLNLGNPSGVQEQDADERIQENYRRLQHPIGLAERQRCYVHQVHGGVVVPVETGKPHDGRTKADALVTRDPGRLLSVRYADCTPVLMSDDTGKVVAAVHAGWRGVIAGVVPRALATMGVEAKRVVAAIGPCITQDAFEVGPEVVEEFRKAFGGDAPVRVRPDGKGMVDLIESIRRQLVSAGVPNDQIDLTDRCTYRDADEFFSHRRDKGVTGRMAAVIGVKA